MSRRCEICGKGPVAGRTITRRGLAKKKGGVGKKITGITKRVFLPNLQTVRVIQKGTHRRIKVCTSCIKAGKIQKA
ncbi:50S ribosomal protein L28 [Candidatus Omnitrophota bacterium]